MGSVNLGQGGAGGGGGDRTAHTGGALLIGQSVGAGDGQVTGPIGQAVAAASSSGFAVAALRPSSVRAWAGRCFNCQVALQVTVKRWADGRDKCVVSPYEPSLVARSPSRSRSRSPTPVLSPLRPGDPEAASPVDDTLLDMPSVGQDIGVNSSSLPDGQDTRLLDLFEGQSV